MPGPCILIGVSPPCYAWFYPRPTRRSVYDNCPWIESGTVRATHADIASRFSSGALAEVLSVYLEEVFQSREKRRAPNGGSIRGPRQMTAGVTLLCQSMMPAKSAEPSL